MEGLENNDIKKSKNIDSFDEREQFSNDLVHLPNDTSTLTNLTESQAKPGMIIIFKQLEVSAASRWQPQISAYKTANILSVEGCKIQVQLARRDFHIVEKAYNEQGERIYRGFETIDLDETEDDGLRDFTFNELIDPKILKVPAENIAEECPLV